MRIMGIMSNLHLVSGHLTQNKNAASRYLPSGPAKRIPTNWQVRQKMKMFKLFRCETGLYCQHPQSISGSWWLQPMATKWYEVGKILDC